MPLVPTAEVVTAAAARGVGAAAFNVITLEHVDYNVDIPANQFDVPADVKALAPK